MMIEEQNTELTVSATAEQIIITEQPKKFNQEERAIIIAKLAELYPKTFFVESKQRKPLMVGIKKKLFEALPELSKPSLEKTLTYYCFSLGYLHSFERETHRFDLNGEPIAELTESDKIAAKAKLKAANTRLSQNKSKITQKSDTDMAERETLTLKRKSTHKTEPAKPVTQTAETSDMVNASAKSAKITLVLDTHSITRISSEGKKQVKLVIQVGEMQFNALLNSKSYRKAIASIDELGADNCHAILQGSMPKFGELEGVGLTIQPKKAKEQENDA